MPISTHAPARGATSPDQFSLALVLGFQPTLLHEERPSRSAVILASSSIFQPTLLHEERPSRIWPYRECTQYFNPRSCTRSDPQSLQSMLSVQSNFNPRSCTRSDLVGRCEDIVQILISTHAPARGATMKAEPFVHARINFNPRSCTRSDRVGARAFDRLIEFQPTLLHEERPDAVYHAWGAEVFQPTLLHEERPMLT